MSDDEWTTNPHNTVVTALGPSTQPNEEATRDACLVVIYGDALGRRIPLGSQAVHIGRSARSDVQIDQESVSRNHCRIQYNGRSFSIDDLGSTNGTYVNDRPLEAEMHLRDGDQIKVGRSILKFLTGGNVETQYHEEIYRLMTVDGLTEVHNKRYFDEVLEREVSRSRRYGRYFSLLIFDIDHFKDINDNYGHLAGDAVLRQLGLLIRARVRRDDIVARIGGEEFGIILPEIRLDGAVELADNLRALVEESVFEFEGTRMPVTLSVGVAEWTGALEDPQQFVKEADERLYEAKGAGRNRVCS